MIEKDEAFNLNCRLKPLSDKYMAIFENFQCLEFEIVNCYKKYVCENFVHKGKSISILLKEIYNKKSYSKDKLYICKSIIRFRNYLVHQFFYAFRGVVDIDVDSIGSAFDKIFQLIFELRDHIDNIGQNILIPNVIDTDMPLYATDDKTPIKDLIARINKDIRNRT